MKDEESRKDIEDLKAKFRTLDSWVRGLQSCLYKHGVETQQPDIEVRHCQKCGHRTVMEKITELIINMGPFTSKTEYRFRCLSCGTVWNPNVKDEEIKPEDK